MRPQPPHRMAGRRLALPVTAARSHTHISPPASSRSRSGPSSSAKTSAACSTSSSEGIASCTAATRSRSTIRTVHASRLAHDIGTIAHSCHHTVLHDSPAERATGGQGKR